MRPKAYLELLIMVIVFWLVFMPVNTNAYAEAEAAEAFVDVAAENSNAAEVECNWTLVVSDTVTMELSGSVFTCKLEIIAIKLGGMDELGVYEGTVNLWYQYEMHQGNVTGSATGEGQDIQAVIEVLPYQAERYDAAANNGALAELVDFDSMAIGEFSLSGGGNVEESANGANWGKEEEKTITLPYRLAVDGGQIRMELYTIAPGMIFTGLVSGEPV